MLEQLGIRGDEDLKKDVDSIRRYLNRVVPQLEQAMSNLGVDNFTTAYNERIQGLTTLSDAGKQKTTPEALAEHLMDYRNPHRVTLGKLGYKVPMAAFEETDNGWTLTLGGIMLEAKTVSVSGTGTADGNVYVMTADAGDWDVPFDALLGEWMAINGAAWAGGIEDGDETACGTVMIYGSVATIEAEITIYGIGGASNG